MRVARVTVTFGTRPIGTGHSCLVVAELGINHSGSLAAAHALIDGAKAAGADALKFQAGDPERYVNRSAWDTPRETPWGTMPYIEYRKRMELSDADFMAINAHCNSIGMWWFVSPLDAHSVERFERFNLPAYKVASPKLTDSLLLQRLTAIGRTLIVSTGMSTFEDIDKAVDLLPRDRIALLHTTSAYPCPDTAINLKAISRMQERYPDIPIGYSGHESGLWPSLGAVSLGACVVERHFTLDRASWGSDQAASLEPSGFAMLVRGIRSIESALSGDGQKALRENEMPNYNKFRSVA
jgi:N-acetylneuraminate synthase